MMLMQGIGKWVSVIGLVAAFGGAQAQDITGAWKGKLKVDMSKLPKPKDAAQKKQMDAFIQTMIDSVKVNLTMKANKTFSLKLSGLPQRPGADGKVNPAEQNAEGTWTQKGAVIMLKITKSNGVAPKGENPPQRVNILDGGKRLDLEPEGGRGMGGKIIFTRQ